MNQYPLCRLMLPFAAGIITAILVQEKIPFLWESIIALFIITAFIMFSAKINIRYHSRWIFGCAVHILLLLTGYQLVIEKTEKYFPAHFSNFIDNETIVTAEISEAISEKKNSIKALVKIMAVSDEFKWRKTKGKAIVYFQKDSSSLDLKYGDRMILCSKFSQTQPPQNPSEFDYKSYLAVHSVYHQAYAKSGSWKITGRGNGNPIIYSAYKIRDNLLGIFKKYGITGDEYAVVSALMLGYTNELDAELRQAYSSAGVTHILAVSGLHVGIIYIIINAMLMFLEKIKYGHIIKALIIILFLWGYASMTGLSPAVIRAATMFSFIVVGKSLKRYTNIYNTIAASVFLLLMIDPYMIVYAGFQLSYIAVIGIVMMQPGIYRLWETNNWLLDKIWAVTSVSLAAQIATFPLCLLYFHQFPNYFLFSNLIVIPLSTVIIYLGAILLTVSPFAWLAGMIAKLLSWSIEFLNYIVTFTEQLPYSITQGISISTLETVIIYLLIASLLGFFMLNYKKYLMVSLFFTIALLASQLTEKITIKEQRKMIVYNVSKTQAYDFIDGQSNALLTNSSLATDEQKMLFHIRQNWWNLGIKNTQFINTENQDENLRLSSLFARENYVQFYNKKIAIVKEIPASGLQQKKIKVDYLIISGNPYLSIKQLKRSYEFGKIIIDSSNSFRKASNWLKQASELRVSCYSVLHNGAFVTDI